MLQYCIVLIFAGTIVRLRQWLRNNLKYKLKSTYFADNFGLQCAGKEPSKGVDLVAAHLSVRKVS